MLLFLSVSTASIVVVKALHSMQKAVIHALGVADTELR